MSASATAMATTLTAQAAAMVESAQLYEAQALLGRMDKNLSAIGASGAWVSLAGGDLYQLASTQYGDAAEWATIARANGLTEPQVSGVQSILIPPTSADTQGVLTDLVSPEGLGDAPTVFVETPGPGAGGVLDLGNLDTLEVGLL